MIQIVDNNKTSATDINALLSNANAIVVGCGLAGAVTARELAERANRQVVILEQRPHIGGNTYDEYDQAGVLVHRYGPHIFHSNIQRVYEYLSRFTNWLDYQHHVLADIHGTYTPVPFNFNSIEQHFSAEKAAALIERLTSTFGENTKVPIIELRNTADPLLFELADFVYQNVFLFYTQKQWGVTPEQVDPTVTARVPVLVGRDDRYFTDTYQGMPTEGYTVLFNKLLDHPNITVITSLDARDVLSFNAENFCHSAGRVATSQNLKGDSTAPSLDSATARRMTESDTHISQQHPFTQILVNNQPFSGQLIYTGPLDFLVQKRFGLLPYRSLEFVYKTLSQKHVLPCGTVNYTVSEDYTRVTEFTYLSGQDLDVTTIMEEYSLAFEDKPELVPYYAILDSKNEEAYQRYLQLFSQLDNFHAIGRLAEYRYYNMDQIVDRALNLADRLCE